MINETNMQKCVLLLKEYFKEKDIYAEIAYPSSLKQYSQEYFIYMFYSCLLDYGMRSKIYHQNLVNTYNKIPQLFNPQYVLLHYKENEEALLCIIRENIHPRYPKVATKKWLQLSLFFSLLKTDLLSTLLSFKSYEELYHFIISIHGYGQKTGGLLIRTICESPLLSLEMKNIPIDRHDIEISYLNGIIPCKKITEKQIMALGEAWVRAAKQQDISAQNIDSYLWLIGNQFCNTHNCSQCPLIVNCKKKK